MRYCARCDNKRWVCENHLDRPFLGQKVCGCGGAGARCPACNLPGESEEPRLPVGYKWRPM